MMREMDERGPVSQAQADETGADASRDVAPAALFEEIERCAGAWATEAGEHLSAHVRGGLHIEYKGNNATQPVSEADREAEEFLYQSVHKRFPDHSVIGEEGRDPGLERTPFIWVIDPLDGTTNYLNGLALWCVSIGVLWYGVPVAAAIYAPVGLDGRPALFTAHRGGGTRLNGRPVSVDPELCQRGPRLAALPPFYQQQLERRRERKGGEVRTLGTIALELALTACGALQFSAFFVPRIWDVAAGVGLVLEGAGAVLRRPERGRPFEPFRAFEPPPGLGLRKWQGTIVAGNATLAAEVADRVEGGREVFTPPPPVQF